MRVVVLGAGFGGLELATKLSDQLGGDGDIVLIDKADGFIFGFSKLDVIFGRTQPEAVHHPYTALVKPGVKFVQASITHIDPAAKVVNTSAGEFTADILVVALGADLDPGATPGLLEGGHEFYTPEGAFALRQALANFQGGRVVVGVTSTPFKCPPAPSETALLMHDSLTSRGLRARSEISLVMPLPVPIPPSPAASKALLAAFEERGIGWYPNTTVQKLDPARKVAVFADGSEMAFDLYLGVPKHRVPAVVAESGMTVEGWIPVNPLTLETSYPGVYAVGDVTSVGTPKAGVFSERQAGVVADRIAALIRSQATTAEYDGIGMCYLEFGNDEVARVTATFLSGQTPTGTYDAPSVALAQEKLEFRVKPHPAVVWPRVERVNNKETKSSLPAIQDLLSRLGVDMSGATTDELPHNQWLTSGVWRVHSGEGRPAVLKFVRSERSRGETEWDAHWTARDQDPARWNYWAREALAYQNHLPEVLAGTGIEAPACLASHVDDRQALLLLEWVNGQAGESWQVDAYAPAAEALARAQAPFLAGRPLPSFPWLSEGFLRQYSCEKPVEWEILDDEEAWQHPLVRETFPQALRDGVVYLHAHRERLYDINESLPRTLCHLDFWPKNLVRLGGHVVLIDWGFAGLGSVGEDVGNLVPDSCFDHFVTAENLPQLERVVFDSYLRGLRSAGWNDDPRLVQLGMWSSAVKYDWLAPFTLAQVRLDRQYRYGGGGEIDPAFKFRQRSRALLYNADRAKQAVDLADQLGL